MDGDHHPLATDPLTRVLFVLLRDHVSFGVVEEAVEKCRVHLKAVPPSGAGLVACELADRVKALEAKS